ncbi:MAG: hypothetical protein AAGC47_15210 [Bacteroidota bacterium]
MKKKIAIGVMALGAVIFGATAYAHSKKSPEEKVTKITKKMAKKLELTDEQKEKVFAINMKRSQGHLEAYNQGRKKEVIVKAVRVWETEMKNVLIEAQAKKLGL